MRFCTTPWVEGLLAWLFLSFFLQFVILFPRSYLSRVLSSSLRKRAKPRAKSRNQPEEKGPLFCYNFMPDGGDVTIVNETQSSVEEYLDASSSADPPQPCAACQYWRYFDFAAEGKTFRFADLAREFSSFKDVVGDGNSTKPKPTTTWGRGGGSCLRRAERPAGCYLLLHVKLDYLGAVLSSMLDAILKTGRPPSSHETIVTLNSLEDEWMLRWEVSSLQFTMGNVDAVHQLCYCQKHLCNGDLGSRKPNTEEVVIVDDSSSQQQQRTQ